MIDAEDGIEDKNDLLRRALDELHKGAERYQHARDAKRDHAFEQLVGLFAKTIPKLTRDGLVQFRAGVDGAQRRFHAFNAELLSKIRWEVDMRAAEARERRNSDEDIEDLCADFEDRLTDAGGVLPSRKK